MHISAKTVCDNCKKEIRVQHWTTLKIHENFKLFGHDFCDKKCLIEWCIKESKKDK